jgi:hypothetical protein
MVYNHASGSERLGYTVKAGKETGSPGLLFATYLPIH